MLVAMLIRSWCACALAGALVAGCSTPGAEAATADTTSLALPDVVIHPIVGPHFLCLEHPLGQLRALGDALGSDCLVPELGAGPVAKWPAFYRGDGRNNEDWYGRADGVRVLYAHVRDVVVRVGDRVRAGQRVARVGNNGPAWFPHTHVGAWRGTTPLQVRFDLRAMGSMSRAR